MPIGTVCRVACWRSCRMWHVSSNVQNALTVKMTHDRANNTLFLTLVGKGHTCHTLNAENAEQGQVRATESQ